MKRLILFLIFLIVIIGCAEKQAEQTKTEENQTGEQKTQIANPASVYCEEKGGKLEIRADADGNQYGICIFPDGSECEEWKFFRGECKKGQN